MPPSPDLGAATDPELAAHITRAAAAAADAALARAADAPVPADPALARAAEAELCRRFAPRVRLYGLRHLRDEHAAADLVQRVLLLTLEKLRADQVRQPDQIASFILGTARMMCHEQRRTSARTEPLDAEALPELDWRPPEPLGAEALARCFETLTDRAQSVLLFSFYQDQSAADIARQLGLKETNVRVIRHRAIESLRACMGLAEESV